MSHGVNRKDDFVEDHAHMEKPEQSHADKNIVKYNSCNKESVLRIST